MNISFCMKTAFSLLLVSILLACGCSQKSGETATPTSPEKVPESRVKRDADGHSVVTLDAETQKVLGLQVLALTEIQLPQSIKSYGRVLDGGQLATQLAELTAADASSEVSKKELQRLKTLAAQNNASERALQTAEAAAARDQSQIQALRVRLISAWGKTIIDRPDLPVLVQSLASLSNILVQLNLAAGETLTSPPAGARILPALSTNSIAVDAQFAGSVPMVDPQLQGQAFFFVVSSNSSNLLPGAAVTGYITYSGEPQTGVLLPRNTIVRFNGMTWVYQQTSEKAFARIEVQLLEPLSEGWFVRKPLKTGDKVVTVGAQLLLSEELKEQVGE